MVLYNLCYYFWGQHCWWTGTNIFDNDFFVFYKFQLPSTHWCRSRQIFGGAKDFSKISLNFPEKKFQKKRLHFFLCWAHFLNQSTSSTIFAQISPKLAQSSPNLPEKNQIKTWPPKRQKSLHFDFGCHFCKIKALNHLQRFCERFHKFCPNFHRFSRILSDFARIFIKSKVLGVRLYPLHPTSYTSPSTLLLRPPAALPLLRPPCILICGIGYLHIFHAGYFFSKKH